MFRALTIIVTACALSVVTASAQDTGAVVGMIRFESSAPVAGATIWTVAGGLVSDARTDSLGRYRLDRIPAGPLTIEVICPGNGSFAPTPVPIRRTVVVERGRDNDLSATIPRDGCTPIPERSVRVHWRGSYRLAFEESSFTPCPNDSLAREVRSYGHPFSRHAWVRVAPNAWQTEGLGQLGEDPQHRRISGFVEWSGILRGPGRHGHVGTANYELTVDSIFVRSPSGQCQ